MAIKKHLPILFISLLVIILDQWSKMWIVKHFAIGQAQMMIPNFFDLVHIRNFGAAFGIFATHSENIRHGIFYVITIVAFGMLINLYLKNPPLRFAVAAIMGGAIGNIIDRITRGSVVDFLYFHYHQYYWPAFNVADIAISCGVVYLVIKMYLLEKQSKAGAA